MADDSYQDCIDMGLPPELCGEPPAEPIPADPTPADPIPTDPIPADPISSDPTDDPSDPIPTDPSATGPDLPPPFEWDPTNPPPPPAPPDIPPTGDYTSLVNPVTGLPEFMNVGAPDPAQDFTGLTDDLVGFETPGDLDAAPDFQALTAGLEGFETPGDPDVAPGFEFTAGQYGTPEGAFQGEGLYGGLEEFSEDWLSNPNRFMSELAVSTRETSEAELNQYELDQSRAIEERMSQRGLVGSSYEGEAFVDLAGELARARSSRETDILRMTADAETADRRAAGELGIQTGQFGAELGGARVSEAEIAQQLALERGHLEITAQDQMDAAEQWRSQLALETAGTESSQDRADVALGLQAAGQEEESNLARGGLALETSIQAANAETAVAGLQLDSAQMQEASAQFRSEFALEAERIGVDAAFRNVELQQRDTLQRAALELDAVIAGDRAAIARVQQELDSIRIQEQAIMDRATLEQRDQELALRANEIQTEAALRGEEIDTDRARIIAEIEWRQQDIESRERIAGETETGLRQRHAEWLAEAFAE